MRTLTPLQEYEQTALNIYNQLAGSGGQLITCTNYWQAGNVFDTVTDFMQVALKNNLLTSEQVSTAMSAVYSKYDLQSYSYGGNSGDWYDDFGWWGIASAKAFDSEYNSVFGSLAPGFKTIAQSCWNIMTNGKPLKDKGAPNVWANCDQTKFAAVAPYFDGGVWQYDINDTKYNPLTPSVKLGPYQVTVVNGLYFVLSLRLRNAGVPVGNAVQNMYRFLTSWCFDVGIKNGKSMLYYGSGGALVLERVPVYKSGGAVNPHDWEQAHTAWCGDQGLIIGAMTDYLKLVPGDNLALKSLDLLTTGVTELMSPGHVVGHWYPTSNNHLQSHDSWDYSSGAGVFMRYLLYAYKNNPAIRTQVITPGTPLNTLITSSANACVNGSYPLYGNPLFDQFNQLSILTMAIGMLSMRTE